MSFSANIRSDADLSRPKGRVAGLRGSMLQLLVAGLLFAILAAIPLFAAMTDQQYLLIFTSRLLIMGLAACGLNLILGYGGLVSFGHAIYIGIGAYVVGICAQHGITNGALQLLIAFATGTVAAIFIGSISLRTTGISFIMITLAFAQMAYVVALSLKRYGGEDGFPLAARSELGPIKLSDPLVLYYTAFFLLVLTLLLMGRLVRARFGVALRATKENARRMTALGFDTLRINLVAYVFSALICVLAGFLLANLTRFVSPSYMQWSVSAELIVMVVLGGMGTIVGPLLGAAALMVFEEVLSNLKLGLPGNFDAYISSHWLAALGLFIVVVTLALKRGIYGSLSQIKSKP
ncbi:MAG: branched-chain amino acid ABC transporter permease [Pseudorhodoplanes sp.]|uniref:branched-chain amino acid ABC transporter permease n=1 Tax=Pseudorhodoplanes sp. TaxID=1934341 RepID=UPI003D0BFC98